MAWDTISQRLGQTGQQYFFDTACDVTGMYGSEQVAHEPCRSDADIE